MPPIECPTTSGSEAPTAREHGGDVAGHRLAVVGRRQARLAVAADVDGDHRVVRREVAR